MSSSWMQMVITRLYATPLQQLILHSPRRWEHLPHHASSCSKLPTSRVPATKIHILTVLAFETYMQVIHLQQKPDHS